MNLFDACKTSISVGVYIYCRKTQRVHIFWKQSVHYSLPELGTSNRWRAFAFQWSNIVMTGIIWKVSKSTVQPQPNRKKYEAIEERGIWQISYNHGIDRQESVSAPKKPPSLIPLTPKTIIPVDRMKAKRSSWVRPSESAHWILLIYHRATRDLLNILNGCFTTCQNPNKGSA